MARDDLLSTKHDQMISGAVSVYLNSNGGSLSICLLLKSKRSIGLCIFSLMNSLLPTSFFPSLSQARAFPKSQVTVSVFFPSLWGLFFLSLSRQMSENVALMHLFQMTFQYKFGSMYIRQQTIMTLSLFIYLCGRENIQLSNILQLMVSGKIRFQIQRQRKHSIHIPQQTNDTT